jgi:hypothetical protein
VNGTSGRCETQVNARTSGVHLFSNLPDPRLFFLMRLNYGSPAAKTAAGEAGTVDEHHPQHRRAT